MCGCLSNTRYWGPGLLPRHMPWLGIELTTLWFAGQRSIHWAIPARAMVLSLTIWNVYFLCPFFPLWHLGFCYKLPFWYLDHRLCIFHLQVKVSFDLNTIQIKYLDEENEEVKYIMVPIARYPGLGILPLRTDQGLRKFRMLFASFV